VGFVLLFHYIETSLEIELMVNCDYRYDGLRYFHHGGQISSTQSIYAC
jgi:hypothetical protein